MLDLSKFSAPRPMSPTLGNSEHPVAKYVTSLGMRWFDNDCRTAVVGLKDLPEGCHYADCKAVTYRVADHSIQFHRFTPKELKAQWDAKQPFEVYYEVLDIPATDKWIGNLIHRALVD